MEVNFIRDGLIGNCAPAAESFGRPRNGNQFIPLCFIFPRYKHVLSDIQIMLKINNRKSIKQYS